MADPMLGRTAVRGSYAKTAARRAEIVRAGFDVFAAGGYHAASLRDVARRVGLSAAGLLHHFPSKWELLRAILVLRDHDAFERIRVSDGSPGVETIRRLIDLADYNATVPGIVELYCVLSAEATQVAHPAHDYFVHRYEWSIETVAAAFADMSARGELLPGVDPHSAAVRMIAMMDGLQVQWLLHRGAVDMSDQLRRSIQSLCSIEL